MAQLQLRPESTSESLSSLSPELLLGAAPSGTNLLTVPVPDQPQVGLSEENTTACWSKVSLATVGSIR
ncbi:MAG: hypothetical protein QOI50_5619 [Pseudonocardiales bacterium]|nr:hypothetical protein [Pseudonocardiales bacterium]